MGENAFLNIADRFIAPVFGSGKTITNVRIFWKIVIDVYQYQIRAQKHISLWFKVSPENSWCRFISILVDLSLMNNPNVSTNPDGLIHFEGGFLEYEDQGLRENIQRIAVGIAEKMNESENSSAIEAGLIEQIIASYGEVVPENWKDENGLANVGRNIYLEVELNTWFEHIGTSEKMAGGPIFHYPQVHYSANNCNDLLLSEVPESQKNKTKRLEWQIQEEIDGRGLANVTRPFFVDDFHLIVINQEECGGIAKFNYLVDAVPALPEPNRPPASVQFPYNGCLGEHFDSNEETTGIYPFSTGPLNFYIGYNPTTNPNRSFHGQIRRLVFDPNASCLGCT